jgi:hypothetical protein
MSYHSHQSHPDYEKPFRLSDVPEQFKQLFGIDMTSPSMLRRYVKGVEVAGYPKKVRLPAYMLPGKIRAFSLKQYDEFFDRLQEAYAYVEEAKAKRGTN